MINVHCLTFNPFQENSYILNTNKGRDCIVFDPGASNESENELLLNFIKKNDLNPVRLINTHCHIDHVLANMLIADTFGLTLEAHRNEVPILESCEVVSKMYGVPYSGSPRIANFLQEGEVIKLAEHQLEILLTPGHSPGSLCFVDKKAKIVIGGDVLFYGSIGRTDLPGGNHESLISSIKNKLLSLPDDFVVYPGHGPKTTIGFERVNNPFLMN